MLAKQLYRLGEIPGVDGREEGRGQESGARSQESGARSQELEARSQLNLNRRSEAEHPVERLVFGLCLERSLWRLCLH
jgi:hypothetical protein